jgi:hypothetical protein
MECVVTTGFSAASGILAIVFPAAPDSTGFGSEANRGHGARA